eukprot:73517_1
MRKNKDYDKRSTTKIINKSNTNNNNNKPPTSIKKKKIHSSSRKKTNLFGSGPLREQKSNTNSMYSNISLTIQEKYLQNQYVIINKKLQEIKHLNEFENNNSNSNNNNNISIEDAISNDLHGPSSSNIILEPGQQNMNNNTSNYSETFIKLSTQYIAKQNMKSSNICNGKNGIDINDYFHNNNNKNINKLNKQKAIEKLKQLGDTQIGTINI